MEWNIYSKGISQMNHTRRQSLSRGQMEQAKYKYDFYPMEKQRQKNPITQPQAQYFVTS